MPLTSPPSDPLDDPLRNAWVGCLWPIARNFILTVLTFAAAVYAGLATRSWAIGLICLVCLVVCHDLVRRRFWKPQEDAASDRLFGIDRNN